MRRLPPLAFAPKSKLEGSIIPPDFSSLFLPLSRVIWMSFSFCVRFSCANAWICAVRISTLWFGRYTAAMGCFPRSPLGSLKAGYLRYYGRGHRQRFLLQAFDDKKRFARKRLRSDWSKSHTQQALPERSSFATRNNPDVSHCDSKRALRPPRSSE